MLKPNHKDWLWARLERPSTDSFMTICMGPWELDEKMIKGIINRGWPGWEIIHYGMGCFDDPVPDLCPEWPGDPA